MPVSTSVRNLFFNRRTDRNQTWWWFLETRRFFNFNSTQIPFLVLQPTFCKSAWCTAVLRYARHSIGDLSRKNIKLVIWCIIPDWKLKNCRCFGYVRKKNDVANSRSFPLELLLFVRTKNQNFTRKVRWSHSKLLLQSLLSPNNVAIFRMLYWTQTLRKLWTVQKRKVHTNLDLDRHLLPPSQTIRAKNYRWMLSSRKAWIMG